MILLWFLILFFQKVKGISCSFSMHAPLPTKTKKVSSILNYLKILHLLYISPISIHNFAHWTSQDEAKEVIFHNKNLHFLQNIDHIFMKIPISFYVMLYRRWIFYSLQYLRGGTRVITFFAVHMDKMWQQILDTVSFNWERVLLNSVWESRNISWQPHHLTQELKFLF